MRKYSSICFFTPVGRTYTFRDVEMLCDNETEIQIGYTAMSDGLYKVATFPKNTMCGWSVTSMPEPEEMIPTDFYPGRAVPCGD